MATLTVGIISQKGGVGKSTIARAIATEFARNKYQVLIADMDTSQATATSWGTDRLRNEIEPRVYVQAYSKMNDVDSQKDNYDLVVIDGAPASNRQTLEIANRSDFLVLPTKVTLDDLRPQISLAHQLVKSGISRKKLSFILSMVGKSSAEIQGAREYIEEAGYKCLGVVPQKDSIGQAHDTGRSALETPFASVNKAVDRVVEAVANELQNL
jgi:chromosome partitioning protein